MESTNYFLDIPKKKAQMKTEVEKRNVKIEAKTK